MPVVRVKSDGKRRRAGHVVAALSSVIAAVSLGLYAFEFYDIAVYACVLAGTACSVYSVFDRN
jgi:CO/xanthine dehydrogenase Mo-binding subunit